METKRFSIYGPVLFQPKRFEDDRGYFSEVFRQDAFIKALGQDIIFVQENQSFSREIGTLRGLHYQAPPHAQGKLVRVLAGEILDVIVDVRQEAPTYGQHLKVKLSADSLQQLWVPPGFLHGFVTRAPNTIVAYKVTDYYAPDCDGSVHWDSLDIDWGLAVPPTVSEKDATAPDFAGWTSPFTQGV